MDVYKPIDLLNPLRLDITSRTLLARAIIRNWSISWPFELYKEVNDKVHSDNWNEPPKQNSFDYLSSFIELISSLKKNGYRDDFGTIPLSEGSPINGAHRIAAAIDLGIDVTAYESNSTQEVQDINFLYSVGVETIYLDAMISEYAELIKYSRIFVCIGVTDDELMKIQNSITLHSELVAVKELELTEIGKRRLIDLMYSHNDWWNIGVLEKFVHERFNSLEKKVHIILYDARKCDDITELKRLIRSHLGEGKFDRKIHGSDFHHDTLILTRTVFNKNGIHFLNYAPIGAEVRILNFLNSNQLDLQTDYPSLLTGSATLECYGIRNASDIDFISLDNSRNYVGSFARSKNILADTLDDDLILDPRNFFIYKEIRSLSLSALLKFKVLRSETKDLNDIILVSNFLNSANATYLDNEFQKAAFVTKKVERRKNLLISVWIKLPNFLKNFIRKFFL